MTPTEISQEKIEAYEATHYHVGSGDNALVLRIGHYSPDLARQFEAVGADCALFITAFNPFGQKHDDASNEAAHAELGKELRALSRHVVEGEGADPSGKWGAEKSYLSLATDADTARQAGTHAPADTPAAGRGVQYCT